MYFRGFGRENMELGFYRLIGFIFIRVMIGKRYGSRRRIGILGCSYVYFKFLVVWGMF